MAVQALPLSSMQADCSSGHVVAQSPSQHSPWKAEVAQPPQDQVPVQAAQYWPPQSVQASSPVFWPSLHLHWPAPLQTSVAGFVQSLSGSVFAVTAAQVPLAALVLLLLQAWHAAPHAVLQQNPSTQWPLAHCVPMVQLAPWALSGLHVVVAGSQ